MDEDNAGGNSTSTRCRFCGGEPAPEAVAPEERTHIQVIVACGSCGGQFAAFSAN